jgi:5-methylcytosine-specific restriction enzyme subunit McrC
MSSSKYNHIKVFEHSSITYCGRYETPGFTKSVHQAFERFYVDNEKTPFFSMIPYGVRFHSYVGAIHIGSTTIEVLPKAGKENDPEVWQNVLLTMLKSCHLLTAKSTGIAPLRLRSNSILDLYFEWFLSEMDYLIRRGLIKRYHRISGQQNSLKGSIDFPNHLAKNNIHQERFFSRYTTYDRNHLIHQILYQALLLIGRISRSPILKDQINRIRLSYPEVINIKVTQSDFDVVTIDRKTQPYQKALEIARLLLLNYRPDLTSGKEDLLAIMFDMNALWEEYVYVLLKKHLQNDWKISAQQKKRFWEWKTVRPDIVMTSKNADRGVVVIDTKWKRVEDNKPSDADLKQMYVYNHYWDAKQSILLYPRTRKQRDTAGKYRLLMNEQVHQCMLGFVDVLKDGQLNRSLAEEILNKIDIVQ